MLYLEDYLEMIEHLPQELKRELTEMRELDLSVQNSMDTLDKRVRHFFGQCRRGEQNQADTEYLNIRKDYYKVLEDADEKVQLANQMYELVDRYLRRLDSELHKFKCELEADNHGITDILEKRSLELDNSTNGTIQKENRFFNSVSQNQNTASSSTTATPRYRPTKTEKRRDSGATLNAPLEKRQALSAGLATPTVRPTTPNLNQVLQTTPAQSVGYSGNTTLIVQAAAQAIEKTQQMQQGRRTASLKASYEAIQSGASVNSHELLMGRELSSASSAHSVAAIETVNTSSAASSSGQKRQKKKNNTSLNNTSISSQQSSQASTSTALLHQLQQSHSNDSDDIVAGVVLNDSGLVVEQTADGEWTYDPNEPRYCICNQVSYGEMVACDNEECPFEWFHYPCVGVTSSPKGKWYCPQCTSSMRRRRKN